MDDLVHFCQISARHYGYAVSKSNSVPGKNIYITCYPLGSYQGSTINKAAQKTVSMKVNRPFQLIGSVPMSKKVTSKTWTLETCNGKNNHNPSPGAGAHAAHRQLLPDPPVSLKFFGSKPMINQDLSLAWTQFQRRADRAESAGTERAKKPH
jgi:hypothetical protein